ncbi:unnamed protein product [Durusdinium trenchii]|uniref:Uncharacterized protein n=1 Tax=Durusdinium trenchii TaxID=1381693 RepID=A0ABP0JC27_9DINO
MDRPYQDVYEIPVKLIINSKEGQMSVEVPSPELPAQLQSKIAEAVLATWKKQLNKKAAPWGIAATFEWVASNFAKLLMLDAECLHPYEGCDENDCTMRRYAIGPPAVQAAEEEDDEDSEEEEASEEEDDAEAIATAMAGHFGSVCLAVAMDVSDEYALWQSLGHWSVYAEWFVALLLAAAVASAWRGAWLVLDATLWPQRPAASAALGLGWGVVLFGILGFLQPCLAAVANRVRHRRVLWLVDAAYSYAGFWCCVLVWRGAWQLWDAALGFLPESHETGPANMRGAWMSHWVGVFVVLCAGGLRSLNAPPMLILSDTLPPLFGARATCGLRGFSRPLVRCREPPQLMPCQKWHEVVGLPFHSQEPKGCEATPEANAMQERLAALLLEVEHHGGDGRKKLSPEEIEQKKKEAEELGDKFRQLSKKERSEINKTRKERAGQRLAKTGSKSRKFEGEGATSKEDKKKKNKENVKKRFGLA